MKFNLNFNNFLQQKGIKNMSEIMSINSAIPQSLINNVGNLSSEVANSNVAVAVEGSLLKTANSQAEQILQLLPDITSMLPTTNNPPNLGQNIDVRA